MYRTLPPSRVQSEDVCMFPIECIPTQSDPGGHSKSSGTSPKRMYKTQVLNFYLPRVQRKPNSSFCKTL